MDRKVRLQYLVLIVVLVILAGAGGGAWLMSGKDIEISKNTEISWGNTVDGVRVGLSTDKKAYDCFEPIACKVFLKNCEVMPVEIMDTGTNHVQVLLPYGGTTIRARRLVMSDKLASHGSATLAGNGTQIIMSISILSSHKVGEGAFTDEMTRVMPRDIPMAQVGYEPSQCLWKDEWSLVVRLDVEIAGNRRKAMDSGCVRIQIR